MDAQLKTSKFIFSIKFVPKMRMHQLVCIETCKTGSVSLTPSLNETFVAAEVEIWTGWWMGPTFSPPGKSLSLHCCSAVPHSSTEILLLRLENHLQKEKKPTEKRDELQLYPVTQ